MRLINHRAKARSKAIAADKEVVARTYGRNPRMLRVNAAVIPDPWPEARAGEYLALDGPNCADRELPLDQRTLRAANTLRNRALLRLEHDEVPPGQEVIVFWQKVVEGEMRLYCVCGDVKSGMMDYFDIVHLEKVN